MQGLHPSHGATDYGQDLLYTEVIDEPPLYLDHVTDCEEGEGESVGTPRPRIDAGWSGRTVTAAEKVRTDDEILVRIKGFARTDKDIPPPGLFLRVPAVITGGMGIA